MKRPSRFTLVFITVMLGYCVLYFTSVSLYPKFPFEADLPVYSAALLQRENPELYRRDPLYQDGAITERFWASSSLYMRIFQFLHNLSQRNISTTLALLQFIPSFLFYLSFYWFLRIFQLDRWLTLMLSLAMSVWLILRVYEGIASVYYFVFIPIFLRLTWQYLSEPSFDNRSIPLWHAISIGAIIGISPFINSVTGLAFNLLILCLLTTQVLARKMKWTTYIAYLTGLVPCLGLTVLSGAGGATMLDVAAGQHLVERMGTSSLMGVVMNIEQIPFVVFRPSESWLFYISLSVFLVGLSLWLRFTPRPLYAVKLLFVFLSGVFWLWILGNVGFIFSVYLLSRFALKRETRQDYILITALNIAVFNGTALIWFILGFWSVFKVATIALILSEMFRFHYQAFFLISVGLLFMVHHLTERIKDLSVRRLMQGIIVVMIMIQSHQQITLSIEFFVLLSTVIILIWLSRSSKYYFVRTIKGPRSWRAALGLFAAISCAFVVVLVILLRFTWPDLWVSSTPLSLESLVTMARQYQSREATGRSDYLDMTSWIYRNTPPDSLIYFEQSAYDRSGFFRYLTQRALLFTWLDESVGQYSPGLAANNRQIAADIHAVTQETFPSLLRRYEVDYAVVQAQQSQLFPDPKRSAEIKADLVYENSTYKIYSILPNLSEAEASSNADES